MAFDSRLQQSYETKLIPFYDVDSGRAKSVGATEQIGDGQVFINCFPVTYNNATQPDTGEKWIETRVGLHQSNSASYNYSGEITPSVSWCVASLTMTSCDGVRVAAFIENDGTPTIEILQISGGTILTIGSISNVPYSIVNNTVSGGRIFLTELMIGATPTLGVVVYSADNTAQEVYYASTTAGVFTAASLTNVTDADCPSNIAGKKIVGGLVQMDTFAFLMTTDGSVYNSEPGSISSWNGLGVIQAASKPDRGMGLARYKHHIVAFGEDTIEFYNNVGNINASPLQRMDQAFINFGVVNELAHCSISDTLYWVAKNTSGQTYLYKLDGYVPVQLSGPYHNFQLNNDAHPALVPFKMNGCAHICLNVARTINWPVTSAITVNGDDSHPYTASTLGGLLCYNVTTPSWWLFNVDGSLLTNQTVTRMVVSANANSTDSIFMWVGDTGTPGIRPFVMNHNNEQFNFYDRTYDGINYDYGKLNVFLTTNVLDFGTERKKRIHKVRLMSSYYLPGDLGSAPYVDAPAWNTTDNYIYLIYHNQDQPSVETDAINILATYVKIRYVDMQISQNRFYFRNFGSHRKWCFGVFLKTYLPFRVKALELDMSQATV